MGNHGRRYSHEQIRVLDWKDFKLCMNPHNWIEIVRYQSNSYWMLNVLCEFHHSLYVVYNDVRIHPYTIVVVQWLIRIRYFFKLISWKRNTRIILLLSWKRLILSNAVAHWLLADTLYLTVVHLGHVLLERLRFKTGTCTCTRGIT